MRFALVLLCLCAPAMSSGSELHEHPTMVEMLERANAHRVNHGLPKQELSPELVKAAQDHAWYMAKTGTLSHGTNGGPGVRANRHRYPGNYQGEIIACGQSSVSEAFTTWLNSSGHRAIMLGRSHQAGFGFAWGLSGNRWTPYWVGIYGSPAVVRQQPGPTPGIENQTNIIVSNKSSNYSHGRRHRLLRRRG